MIGKTLAALCCALLCSQTALAFERGELLVWINSDKGFNGLAEVGRRFEQETGMARPDPPRGNRAAAKTQVP